MKLIPFKVKYKPHDGSSRRVNWPKFHTENLKHQLWEAIETTMTGDKRNNIVSQHINSSIRNRTFIPIDIKL